MLELLQWIFGSVWRFLGVILLIMILGDSLTHIVRAAVRQ